MTNDEAKFILSAYRPDGSDAGTAAFCDALKMAGNDPALGLWFGLSRTHDAAVAAKLREIAPPAGLREAILAGARVSGPRRSEGLGRAWIVGFAAAAVLAVVIVSMKAPVRPEPAGAAFAGFAINDMVTQKHGGSGEPAGALVAELQTSGSKMPGAGEIDFDKLKDTGCRTISFAGHDVIEMCFVRDGTLFHLYVSRRVGLPGDSEASGPSFITQAAGAAAAWSDRSFDYALASTAGTEAIRRLL
jgi:hypothetical protein